MTAVGNAVVGIAALVACLACSSTAYALTASPAGTYVATSGTTQLTVTSTGTALTCSASSKSFTLAADGTGTIASGATTWSGCTNPLFYTNTYTQTSAWTVRLVLTAGTPNRIAMVLSIPTNGLTIVGLGCTFSLGGTITKSATSSSLPVTLNSLAVSSSALNITSNNGGPLCNLYPVASAATYRSTLSVSPSMTVSG